MVDGVFVVTSDSNLGTTLYIQGRYVEAEGAYREFLRLAPESAIAYHNLASALRQQGRLQEAEAAYREARRLS